MNVRGYCLVWDHGNPQWLRSGAFTAAQLSEMLHEHVVRVMHRYTGRVITCDVVNEPLDESGHLRDSIWYNKPGIGLADKATACVEQAFRWARDADRSAWLFYHDNGGEGRNRNPMQSTPWSRISSSVVFASLVSLCRCTSPASTRIWMAFAANIERLMKLGLQVHITELDVSLPIDSEGTAQKEGTVRQARGLPPHGSCLREESRLQCHPNLGFYW